jgi:hypothetical protein
LAAISDSLQKPIEGLSRQQKTKGCPSVQSEDKSHIRANNAAYHQPVFIQEFKLKDGKTS